MKISQKPFLTSTMQANTYESVWHLILPPVMTFLDDFQASYKLQGVRLVSDLLSRVPPELLKRTGVDGLLFTVRHDNG
jgi:hypothetical protein